MKKYLAGAVLSLGIIISPAFTHAAGLTDQQVQAILSLLSSFGADSATITNVNTALGGTTSSSSSTAFCHTFNNDMTIGSNNDDVGYLRNVLNRENLLTQMRDAPFEEDLAGDVVRFQARYGIRQTGYVGPVTRARLNALYGCSNQTTSQTNTTPTITVTSPNGGTYAVGNNIQVNWADNVAPVSPQIVLNGTVNGLASIVLANPNVTAADRYSWTGSVPTVPSGIYTIAVCDNGVPHPTVPGKQLCGNSTQFSIISATQASTPSISSISPTPVPAGQTTFIIYGSGFQSGATVSYSGNSAGNYNASFSASFVSSSQLSVTGTGLAPNSSYMLFVRNPNGQTSNGCSTYTSCSSSLSVASGVSTGTPIITITSPNGNVWATGTTQTIRWTDSGGIASDSWYTVYVTRRNGSGYGVIRDGRLYNGSQTDTSIQWNVGTLSDGTSLPPLASGESAYYIQVVRQTAPQATSFTTTPNASFTITPQTNTAAPTITLNGSSDSSRLSINVEFGRTATFNWGVAPTTGTSCSAAGIGVNGATGSGVINLSGVWTTPALYTSTTYGIKCTNSAGTTYKYADVTVAAQTSTVVAPTLTFTASPSPITAGQSSTLSWSSTNATSCLLNNERANLSGPLSTGSLYTTSSFTITCTGSGGSITRSATVTVNPAAVVTAPTINSFTASPTSVTSGQPTSLSWNITASGTGTTCSLSETTPTPRTIYPYGNLLLSSSNTGTYSLTSDTTYRIDCRNNEGATSWKTLTIPVTATAAPVAASCTWNGTYVGVWGAGCNATVPAGTTVQSGQTSGLIYNTASGYTTNTSYIQYSCTNGQFTPINPVCVANVAPVNTAAPTISYFYPISASVASGAAPTLDWYVTPASGTTATCGITGNWSGSISQGLRPVSAGGWGANNITSDTTYTLTCINTNAGGSSTSRTTTVTIAAATAPAASTAVSCRWGGGLIGPWGSGCNANVPETTVASGGSTGTINNTVAGYTGYVSFNCSSSGSFTVASQYCAPLTASALNAVESATQSQNIMQGTTDGFSYTFTQDMYRGVQGSEVVALQRALHAEGLFAGEATGNFYDVTREAVMAFQIKYGINPTGYVGPETRAKLNALY